MTEFYVFPKKLSLRKIPELNFFFLLQIDSIIPNLFFVNDNNNKTYIKENYKWKVYYIKYIRKTTNIYDSSNYLDIVFSEVLRVLTSNYWKKASEWFVCCQFVHRKCIQDLPQRHLHTNTTHTL